MYCGIVVGGKDYQTKTTYRNAAEYNTLSITTYQVIAGEKPWTVAV